MKQPRQITLDGNEAAAQVAYRLNDAMTIYPITPASPMGEWTDAFSAQGRPNLWGTVPSVVELQSEGGAAGATHGALQGGALATTFTASQGLLLMLPNMYKIAGELTPTVFHIAARSLACQALSIFCDHSDVMAARSTGFALLASASVQEVMDFTAVSQAATLKSRVPFLHFFDGFRTSHEVSKVAELSDETLRQLIDEKLVQEHRLRALSPDRPVIRGTSQNPDVYFQARETVNPYYTACPDLTQEAMDRFGKLTGRHYHLFNYHGAADAEHLVILMGSGCDTAHETVDYLNAQEGRVGVLKVRLYRPFDAKRFLEALPKTVRKIAVLDRTKEPGSTGEPLYLDCVAALTEGLQQGWGELKKMPTVIGGRYGLGSKEFTSAMVIGVFDHLKGDQPKNHFTVGIEDDVAHTSIPYDPNRSIEPDGVMGAMFYGLGDDGTVGANKNTIKIIGDETDSCVQGYFVYDSKKSGSMTVSHLRFGPAPIRSAYLLSRARFLGCHHPILLEKCDVLKPLADGGTFLLNTPHSPATAFEHLPHAMRKQLVEKKPKFYVIDATDVAQRVGMGRRINTIMQVCFFAVSGVLPKEKAIAKIKDSIQATYGNKGREIVEMNLKAVNQALAHLREVTIPKDPGQADSAPPAPTQAAPPFVQKVTTPLMAFQGDDLPVSAFPADGTYPTGTAKWEKRNIAWDLPVWDTAVCIQCGKCAMVCPHSTIRIKVCDPKALEGAPADFKSADVKDRAWAGMKMTIQVAPEDCTGCAVCVDVCPARNKSQTRLKAINMKFKPPLLEAERKNWDFFLKIPPLDRRRIDPSVIRQQQVQEPLFEFSGACAGCGETPYLKLLSQLFGDRALIGNATGCSSIYGGNLPTTPWTANAQGRGPAWSNSLFEDNAEFALGMRLAVDQQNLQARALLQRLSKEVGSDLAESILSAPQKSETDLHDQRERIEALKKKLKRLNSVDARQLLTVADLLVVKSVWAVGGDGWAYDIGYGGLDHVLASGRNVNVLVLDTEVYSNTGGQMSKATPLAAIAKFASGGKQVPKKDLGLMAISYGNVYVASVAMGARDDQTLKAFLEAEAYEGPSLIIAYSHCIAHGIRMVTGLKNQKAAVESGCWLLYRYDPSRAARGENPLVVDSRAPKLPAEQYLLMENRFKMITKSRPEEAKKLFRQVQQGVEERWRFYQRMAEKPHPAEPVAVSEGKGA